MTDQESSEIIIVILSIIVAYLLYNHHQEKKKECSCIETFDWKKGLAGVAGLGALGAAGYGAYKYNKQRQAKQAEEIAASNRMYDLAAQQKELEAMRGEMQNELDGINKFEAEMAARAAQKAAWAEEMREYEAEMAAEKLYRQNEELRRRRGGMHFQPGRTGGWRRQGWGGD